jgi:hypothetical protein
MQNIRLAKIQLLIDIYIFAGAASTDVGAKFPDKTTIFGGMLVATQQGVW